MTLDGIRHHIWQARSLALKDSDKEEYQKYKELGDSILLMEDTARLAARTAKKA
jgi:hypothetical protein